MRFVKKFIIISLLLLFAFAITGWVVTLQNKEKVKDYIIGKLNEQINTPINVQGIDELNLLDKFPYASFGLSQVLINDPLSANKKDTLIYAEKIYFQLNILDILQNKFLLKKVDVETGKANFTIDKKGQENYLFFDPNTTDSEKPLFISLEKVTLNDIHFTWKNELKKDFFDLDIKEVILKGNFTADKYELDAFGSIKSNAISSEGLNYFANKTFSADLGLVIDKTTNLYQFHRGNITAESSLKFRLTGSVKNEQETFLDLNLNGNNLTISKLKKLLPDSFNKSIAGYDIAGNLSADMKLNGIISKQKTPEITIDFYATNTSIKPKKESYSLTEVELTGIYSNGKRQTSSSSYISVDTLKGKMGEGNIEAQFKISNFKSPNINLQSKGHFTAEAVKALLQLNTLQKAEGDLDVELAYNGKLKASNDYTIQDFKASKLTGKLLLHGNNFQIKGTDIPIENLIGEISIKNNLVKIEELKGKLLSSDFKLSGILKNLIPYLSAKNETLYANTNLISDFIDINELLTKKNASKSDSTYQVDFPERIQLTSNFSIEHLSFRKFVGQNIAGKFSYANKKLTIINSSLNALNGKINLTGSVSQKASTRIFVTSKSSFSNIDITTLFDQFENFGQNYLLSKHLKGQTTTNIYFASVFDNELNIDNNKTFSTINLTINNGELIGFKPLLAISDYIKEKKLYAAFIDADKLEKSLKHIRFSTLQNELIIKNQVITIPLMDVKSDAIDLELEGLHTFDHKIDYQVNFYLSDLFDQDENVKSNYALWEIRSDSKKKHKMFIKMGGDINNPTFTHNKKAFKNEVNQKIKAEKKEVKSILKEELNLFKNEPNVPTSTKESPKFDYDIIWNEDDGFKPKESKEKQAVINKPVNKKKGLKGLFNIEENEKETEEFNIDDLE